jgi:hypothetical protein
VEKSGDGLELRASSLDVGRPTYRLEWDAATSTEGPTLGGRVRHNSIACPEGYATRVTCSDNQLLPHMNT